MTLNIQRIAEAIPPASADGTPREVPGTPVADTAATTSGTRVGIIALVMAGGLLAVAYADSRARLGHVAASYVLLWVGLAVIYVPAVVHAWRAPSRGECITVLVLLGLALYMVKVLHSPVQFTDHDEFSTLRTTLDINRLGQPFHHNPLITVHPYFPGLELATSALSSLTGASVFVSALVVIGAMRIVMMLALFLLFERVASCRVAALATVLYAANPNFVFFNAQWAYESFSLPLALLVIALAARAPWSRWNGSVRAALPGPSLRALGLLLLIVITVLISHPLTSYALLVALFVWAAVDTWMARRAAMPRRPELWILGLSALGISALWTGIFGQSAGGYFGPVLSKAAASAVNLLLGDAGPKQLFTAPGLPPTPIAERLAALASVLIALAVIPLGLIRLRRQLTPLRVTLGVAAVLYVPSLPLRLTQAGTEISNRASEFVYVGIAFLAAVVLSADWRVWRPSTWRRARALAAIVVVGVSMILFGGGIVIGWARYARIPGPYLVVADERSVEPEGVAASRWARRNLKPLSRILVDRANGLLMGSYGGLDPVGGDFLGRNVPGVLLGPRFDGTAYYVLRKNRIDAVIVDSRLATGLPLVGIYAERDEPQAYAHRTPPTRAALLKYDGICPIPLVFDSGHVFIFDTRSVDLAGCPPPTRPPHRYDRFPSMPLAYRGARFTERGAIEQFDQLTQDPAKHVAALSEVRRELQFIRDQLQTAAQHPDAPLAPWLAWRLEQIDARLAAWQGTG